MGAKKQITLKKIILLGALLLGFQQSFAQYTDNYAVVFKNNSPDHIKVTIPNEGNFSGSGQLVHDSLPTGLSPDEVIQSHRSVWGGTNLPHLSLLVTDVTKQKSSVISLFYYETDQRHPDPNKNPDQPKEVCMKRADVSLARIYSCLTFINGSVAHAKAVWSKNGTSHVVIYVSG